MPTVDYEAVRQTHLANIASAERSLARHQAAYGGLHPDDSDARERLAKCLEALAGALSVRAAFEKMVASQVREGAAPASAGPQVGSSAAWLAAVEAAQRQAADESATADRVVAAADYARAQNALRQFTDMAASGHDLWTSAVFGRLEWAEVSFESSHIRGLCGLQHAHAVWLARAVRELGWATHVIAAPDWNLYVLSRGVTLPAFMAEHSTLPYGSWGYKVIVRDPRLPL